ncbi:phosphatidylinositol-specific phospholipase C [Serratia ureilytica]|uniref:phosphatidylinositol-specific phospholipase C n=1 Tax=Serratia ureilytica TaxID=300181 RepID=UPI0034C69F48
MNKWMSKLGDNRLITQVSIPGTHDSASFHSNITGAGFTQTQSWDIKQQLNYGVRFLDARCRLIDDVFAMHHGPVYLKQQFGDFLQTCIDFLKRNPTEFIVLSVKKEHTTENSKKSFASVMQDRYVSPHKEMFFLENRIPNVKEVRGKIVLLRRYNGSDIGLSASNWKDNATFRINNNGYSIFVQDEYSGYTFATIKSKREPVRKLVEASTRGKSGDLYINFTSLSGVLVTPYNGAYGDAFTDGMNYWFPKQYKGKHSMGIIVSDYVDIDKGAIIKTVVNSNLFK